MSSSVAILGATGNVGKALLPLLLRDDGIQTIHIVTQRTDKIPPHEKICLFPGNYCRDETVVLQALENCTQVVMILPQSLSSTEMIHCGQFLGDCAKEAGVANIVRLSSLGIDTQSTKHVASQGPLGDAHVAIESYYRDTLGIPTVVSIRPTSFFSNIEYNRSEIIKFATFSTPLGMTAKVNWVSCLDIAKVMAQVLLRLRQQEESNNNNNSNPTSARISKLLAIASTASKTREDTDTSSTGSGSATVFVVVDVTGPKENTLTGPETAQQLTQILSVQEAETTAPSDHHHHHRIVQYKETEIPPHPDYAGLWNFLRMGGFDCETNSVHELTGEKPILFTDMSWIE